MKRGGHFGAGIALLAFGGLATAFAQPHTHMGHSAGMHPHDEATMPGLIAENASAEENPEMVAALHTHAAEVTQMADRGMAAVHEMMMEQGRGH